MTTVRGAFKSARKNAVRHMNASERAMFRWGETSVTEIVTAHAARAVNVVPFTQRAEALSGADWIWWWVDEASAYGMLVQAKRVTIDDGSWSFDFDYKSQKAERSQRDVLRSAAAELDLLPVFAIYLGTGSSRDWEECSKHHSGRGCSHCKRRSVSLMPEVLASTFMVTDSKSTYGRSVALEDMWTPSDKGALLIPTVEEHLASDLAEFLSEQHGARGVSRSMMDLVLHARYGQFALATDGTITLADGSHDDLGPIFQDLPDDTMHGDLPYFEHVLNPLRHAPPDYALEAIHGYISDAVVTNMPESIAGVVVVELSQEP